MDIKFDSATLEKAIVGYCVRNKSFFLKVGIHLRTASSKKKSYFNDPKLQLLLNMFCSFHDKYEKFPTPEETAIQLDRVNETPEVKFFIKKLADDLYNFDLDTVDPDFIKEEAVKFIKSARVVEAMAYAQLDLDKGDFSAISDRMKEAITVNFDDNLGISVRDIKSGLEMIKDAASDVNTVSLGWPTLDSVVGRLRAGELFVFAGVPGIGKTIWLGSVALNNFYDGKNVVVITLETSEKRLLSRYYQNLLRKSKDQLVNEEIDGDFYSETLPETGDIYIKQFQANSASANDINAYLNDLYTYKNFKPDIIIIDYILIAKTNSDDLSSDNSYKYYKKVTEEFRNLAEEFECPVISASQVNREGMGESGGSKAVVTSKQGSESRGILDTADYYAVIIQTSQDKKKYSEDVGAYTLYIDKNRNDKNGVRLPFYVDYKTYTIKEGAPK